jgi:hypothetical protein
MKRLVYAYFFGQGLGVILAAVYAILTAMFGVEPGLNTRSANQLDLVADFGADPTGATDISGALSAAIAAGRPVFIPAGTFLLSGSVTDPGAEPVNITCSGQATTTINLSGSIAISQTGNFTIPFSIKGCGFSFTGSGAITLAGTTYNNSQPLEGPVFQDDYFAVPSGYTGAGPGTLQLACPITYSPTSTAAATSALDIGSTSTPSSAVDTESEPAGITAGMIHTAHAEVPAGWYYELTVTNATIGTSVGIVH